MVMFLFQQIFLNDQIIFKQFFKTNSAMNQNLYYRRSDQSKINGYNSSLVIKNFDPQPKCSFFNPDLKKILYSNFFLQNSIYIYIYICSLINLPLSKSLFYPPIYSPRLISLIQLYKLGA